MQFFNDKTNQGPTSCCVYLLLIGRHPFPISAAGAAALSVSHFLAYACVLHSQLPASLPPCFLRLPTLFLDPFQSRDLIPFNYSVLEWTMKEPGAQSVVCLGNSYGSLMSDSFVCYHLILMFLAAVLHLWTDHVDTGDSVLSERHCFKLLLMIWFAETSSVYAFLLSRFSFGSLWSTLDPVWDSCQHAHHMSITGSGNSRNELPDVRYRNTQYNHISSHLSLMFLTGCSAPTHVLSKKSKHTPCNAPTLEWKKKFLWVPRNASPLLRLKNYFPSTSKMDILILKRKN